MRNGPANIFLMQFFSAVQLLESLDFFHTILLDFLVDISHSLDLCTLNNHPLVLLLIYLLFEHSDFSIEKGVQGVDKLG
jgi:hypothetical protein